MIAFYAFGAVLLLLVGVIIVSAVRAREAEPSDEAARPEERLEAAIAALRELEFDYRTGKVPEDEYVRLREEYGTAAVRAREAVERGAAPGRAPASGGEGVAEERRRCDVCGAGVAAGDRFCGECGAPLGVRSG